MRRPRWRVNYKKYFCQPFSTLLLLHWSGLKTTLLLLEQLKFNRFSFKRKKKSNDTTNGVHCIKGNPGLKCWRLQWKYLNKGLKRHHRLCISVVPSYINQVLCSLHGLELSLQGSVRKQFSVCIIEYAKYVGIFFFRALGLYGRQRIGRVGLIYQFIVCVRAVI